MNAKPISIITVNYNNAEGLRQTLDSVRRQTFKDIDYVIIDGGSSDGSREVIEQNKDILSFYCSEKDKGIYDAQNKGILRSSGSYLLFLNSGDLLAEADFLTQAADFISKNSDHSFIYGDTILKNADGTLTKIIQPDELDLFFFFTQTLNHQSCLIGRDLFSTYGLYETEYKVCADFDFILKVFTKDRKQFKHFNVFTAIYDKAGFSSDVANYTTVENERKLIVGKYFTKAQIIACIRQERKMNSWPENVKKQLYANKTTYILVKLYVKFKRLFWKK